MILKLIILAAVGLFIYRLFGGELPSFKAGLKKKPKQQEPQGDTMVECDRCGTFVMVKEATLVGGKYICNECL